jgi:hypothetical protein
MKSPATPSRYLHVANGTSVTMTLEAAGVPGARSIWADPLHEGPVPGGLSDDELLEVRRQHHSAAAAPGENHPSLDPVNDMRRWRAAIADYESYAELVLWFEHDLFDQLNLIQLLTWIREHVPADKTVSLICIDAFPGYPDFKGLGELQPGELASLFDIRVPVSEAQYTLAGRAWRAFRDSSPEPLDALRSDAAALPYLGAAVTRFLQEYPWTTDGLARTERRLLELASTEPMPLWQAFRRMGEGDRFYTLTDLSFAATANALTKTTPPLLMLQPQEGSSAPWRRIASSTVAGRAVLNGTADRVSLCGIDRWLGGVHLQGSRTDWRWNDRTGQIVRG